MSYLVLARKFRPQQFADVAGQDHVTHTLVNAIAHDRIAHAYIFTGPRGVGKTSIARIFAKSLNCKDGPTADPCGKCDSCRSLLDGSNFDVIEIDGASNNSVNDIRDLRTNIQYGPTTFNYKIYIIDEVHMLSTGAFNALLKTLEEPPPRTMFIFATTEIHKVPMTILSRCQRFDFHRIPLQELVERLRFICGEEGVEIDEDSLYLVARKADGSMRDAQSVLDQLISFSGSSISSQQVVQTLGLIQQELFLQFQKIIQDRDFDAALQFVHDLVFKGYDLVEFLHGLAEHFRHLLTIKLSANPELLDLPADIRSQYTDTAAILDDGDLLRSLDLVTKAIYPLKNSAQPRLHLEMLAMKLLKMDRTIDLQQLLNGGTASSPAKKKAERKVITSPPPATAPVPVSGNATVSAEASTPESTSVDDPGQSSGRKTEAAPAPPLAVRDDEVDRFPDKRAAQVLADEHFSLETVRTGWAEFLTRAVKKSPFLGAFLHDTAPVGIEGSRCLLKIPADNKLLCQTLEDRHPQVQGWLQEFFRVPLELELQPGVIAEEERIVTAVQVHLDDSSRWKELRGEHEELRLLEERFKTRLL